MGSLIRSDRCVVCYEPHRHRDLPRRSVRVRTDQEEAAVCREPLAVDAGEDRDRIVDVFQHMRDDYVVVSHGKVRGLEARVHELDLVPEALPRGFDRLV